MLEGIKAYYIYMMPIWNVKQTIFIIHKKNITYLNVRRNPLQSNIFEHVIVHITLRLGSVLRILNYQPKRVQRLYYSHSVFKPGNTILPHCKFYFGSNFQKWNWKLCDRVYGGSRCDKTVELVSTFRYEYQIFLPHKPILWKFQTH